MLTSSFLIVGVRMDEPTASNWEARDLRSVAEMSSALEERRVTASELVNISMDRIATWQTATNAFVAVLSDGARVEAQAIDSAIVAGKPVGSLAGIPVAVKAAFDIAGRVTTGCSRALNGDAAGADADLVVRLRSAGAVVVGITNQHELGAGATGLVSADGATRNPHDVERLAGGSSSGSAIAVSTGAVPIAIGVDTGGSIRIPASFCGCWGLKPTQGTLSVTGILPLAPSLDCPGVMTAGADDLARSWSILGGAVGASHPPRRVGVLVGGLWTRRDELASVALRAAEATLRDGGVEIVEVDGTGIEDALRVWNEIAWSEFAKKYTGQIDARALAPDTAALLRWGTRASAGLDAARQRRREIRTWFLHRLLQVDALMSPTTPYPAPRSADLEVDIGGGERLDVRRGGPASFTAPVSLAGLPAISAPYDEGRLPIGVQLIGRPEDEESLLSAASVLEAQGPFSCPFPSQADE